ncbi:hypothetical protein Ahy_A08g037739 [Arachis hypogaea]|uniref:Transposase MuDR plant domain-containing protein n=1 Tax=Arachis hypogaea TaxID=3818 RepID=A0A445BRL7_ARAHY|nr:hypothetical protein Ahy_A08g037739 [Arachis hypogaea]
MDKFVIENRRICHVYWDHTVDLPEELKLKKNKTNQSCNQSQKIASLKPISTTNQCHNPNSQTLTKTPPSSKVKPKSILLINQKNRRALYKRPTPTSQMFVEGGRNEAPKIFVLRVEPDSSHSYDDSDSDSDYYQYEYKDLHNLMSSDCEDDYDRNHNMWPQKNLTVSFGQVHLELGMKFATMDEFKRSVRKYNIQMKRSIKFSRVEPTRCKNIYCSRSNELRSYQVNTFMDQHIYVRRHSNKTTNRVWSGHNSRTCQQKKDDILDKEVVVSTAATANPQNQQLQNTGKAAS